jgi:SAM-dependent methyltransferase
MLHLFRRREEAGGGGESAGPVLVSHILAKFLKRLQAMERPYLLDLGPLSGSNIEFFARARCKVQVNDLLRDADPVPDAAGDTPAERESAGAAGREGPGGGGGEPPAAAPDPVPAPPSGRLPLVLAASDGPGEAARRAATAGAPWAELVPGGLRTTAGRIGTALPASPAPPGARPSRRIVLPPRTFPRSAPPAGRAPAAAGAARRRPGTEPARVRPLPRVIPCPDESFDAVVAWDIFNYYDAAGLGGLAGEIRRVLKPGGLLLAYFHARQPQAPDVPRRFRILDDRRVLCDRVAGDPLRRHLYQNRDIEKLFSGLSIVELYFLKNALREVLLEKKAAPPAPKRPAGRAAPPRPPRFTIE